MKAIKYSIGLMLILAMSSFTAPKKATSPVVVDAKLTGVIVDSKTGEALAGVEVAVEGTDLKTYTNFDGEFSFAGLKPGDYKVVTQYVSYKTTTLKSINVKGNEMHALNIELQAELNESSMLMQVKTETEVVNNQVVASK